MMLLNEGTICKEAAYNTTWKVVWLAPWKGPLRMAQKLKLHTHTEFEIIVISNSNLGILFGGAT